MARSTNRTIVFFHFLLIIMLCLILNQSAQANALFENTSTNQTFISQRINFLLNKKPRIGGPNCVNSALWVYGMADTLRYSSFEEMEIWLNSKYCRKKSELEQIEYGDIITVRDNSSILHAMIAINNEFVFSKNTSQKNQAYEIQSANLIFQMFRLADYNCIGNDKPKLNQCLRWATYYRCQTDPLTTQLITNHNLRIRAVSSQARNAGQILENLAFDNKKYNGTESHWIKDARVYLDNAESNMKPKTKKPEFFWRVLELQLQSLEVQWGMVTGG